MMKLVVFAVLVGIAAASLLPLLNHHNPLIVLKPHIDGAPYGHLYGHGYGHGVNAGHLGKAAYPAYGYGHGVSAGHMGKAAYPEYEMYRPVGVHYGGAYNKGLDYNRLGLGYGLGGYYY